MSEANLYGRLVDGLRLAAAPFAVQRSVLPDFVDVPDEIILAVDEVLLAVLAESRTLTDEQRRALADYDKYVGTAPICQDYPEALAEVESGEWFEELRRRARRVHEILEEEITEPTLSGVIYIRGRASSDD